MITLHVALTVRRAEHLPDVLARLTAHAERSRREPGCGRFEVYRSEAEPGCFFLLETWESEAALETHRRADSFLTIYEPGVLPFVDRVVHRVNALPE